eukprot:SRR837773.11666.p3 GENE.SRR837773.11666~~SRR837773.11666.p3  ORF type:complete len:144 (-),score=23.65 SRR837773.11666:52-423(-)
MTEPWDTGPVIELGPASDDALLRAWPPMFLLFIPQYSSLEVCKRRLAAWLLENRRPRSEAELAEELLREEEEERGSPSGTASEERPPPAPAAREDRPSPPPAAREEPGDAGAEAPEAPPEAGW